MERGFEQRIDKEGGETSEEIRIINGEKYRRVPSGYTVRQWFAHETPEKGPGPGWDSFAAKIGEIYEQYGLDPQKATTDDLPDESFYRWERVDEVE